MTSYIVNPENPALISWARHLVGEWSKNQNDLRSE